MASAAPLATKIAATPLLQVRELQAWYGESHILHGVDFDVAQGEVVTLLGRNGAGKTTTLKLEKIPRSSGHQAIPSRAIRFDARFTVC